MENGSICVLRSPNHLLSRDLFFSLSRAPQFLANTDKHFQSAQLLTRPMESSPVDRCLKPPWSLSPRVRRRHRRPRNYKFLRMSITVFRRVSELLAARLASASWKGSRAPAFSFTSGLRDRLTFIRPGPRCLLSFHKWAVHGPNRITPPLAEFFFLEILSSTRSIGS